LRQATLYLRLNYINDIDDEIGKTVAELASRSRAFVNDIRKILADAFAEGRRAARETADTSRVQREDLDLDNPNL